MAVYAYIARSGTSSGVAVRGTITADTPRQARQQLRAQGLAVRDIVEQAPARTSGLLDRYLTARLRGQVTSLLQEVATLLRAGIPLLESLDTISRQHTGRLQRAILLLREHVAGGGGLASAMAQQPGLFDNLCLNIVEVGENAGTLDTAMERLVDFRRRSARMKNRIASALIYPCIVLGVGLVVSVFLMTYVVPNLLSVLIESGRPLPMATVIIKGVSDLVRGWWWAMLLLLFVAGAGVAAMRRSPTGIRRIHRLQLQLPLLGDLIRKQSIGRVAMVMATLLKSDVVFVQALRITQQTVGNVILRDALSACEHAVMAGRDIAAALEQTRAFPPLVVQVFAVGQASGRLEIMLEDLAADYDTHVEIASGRLTAMLEPLLMIALAIVVGLIAFATILPILEAGDVL